jgi:proteasome lid subunit RPN8/RPN11
MLKISLHVYEQIEAHAVSAYPNEGCGLLFGRMAGDNRIVVEAKPMANVWPNEEEKRVRFKIDERAWVAAELDAMNRDLDIIGVFHSHPDHPPIASPRDLAWAGFAGYSYLITEIRHGKPQTSRSWQLNHDRTGFFEEEVKIGS